MPTNADLLLDTSAALARLDRDHMFHGSVVRETAGARLGLAGHARFEAYSVLTRLPPPMRMSPAWAARLLETEFPETTHLSIEAASALAVEVATRRISGGAVYDALVAAAAREAKKPLVTCDQRASRTYQELGVTIILAAG